MAFFDDLTRKLSMVGQEAASQTKMFAEKTKLNSKISDEEKQLNSYFQIIGKNYYEANKDNPNAEYADQILSIKDAYSRIEGLREQLRTVTGVRICPQCGGEVANGSLFCNTCGAKMPEDAVAPAALDGNPCPQCGNVVPFGAAFCNICGSKMPEITQQPLSGGLAPESGSFSTPGFDVPMNTAPAAAPVPVVPASAEAAYTSTAPAAPAVPPIPTPDNPELNTAPAKGLTLEKTDE